ncbi:helix-turn-helix transcriptional regulator [Gordonia sp. TBRC 11910]|uniref:Helix-turn-helix transcriptional regulator n=1 Tax=Gordonia asplenii TaxID=2725283 RepID=A0A848L1G1_9ACTN|nr:helix-turn-helix domain-containing protein [Gordonia asplenii]NMO04539.1 helix-turn-helix transcriptional regulator [Gordonia asplenii]
MADDTHDPDPWRRLLDAVLDADNRSLTAMAGDAHTSEFHFTRQVRARSGESPVALRRRVTLERAAWLLQRGTSVTDCAFDSGYESVEGFSRAFARAFGHPPTAMPPAAERGHWLPAPNGLHFHSPTVLYVDSGAASEHSAGDVLALLVRHDLDDTTQLLSVCTALADDDYRRVRLAGHRVLEWHGLEESIAAVLTRLVRAKLPWLATVEGAAAPNVDGPDDVASLRTDHENIAPRWLAMIRDVERRDAWADMIIDALCEPPESFLMSQIVAHEITFAAHRRQLLRWMLADAGVELSSPATDPDPIMWHRRTWHADT